MIIGLTGGIGSGKSVVAKIFEILGCVVFNSDQLAKNLYFEPAIREKIIKLMGSESYLSETKIDRSYISKNIFSNRSLLQELNALIHPEVALVFKKFVFDHPNKIIVKESALLFEADLTKQVQSIVLVAAEDELRIDRVIKRDGISKEDVIERINAQWPQDEKIKKADFVIYNNEREFLTPQVIDILSKIKHD